MQFYSTKNKNVRVGLAEALMRGIAPDGGLLMPTQIPQVSPNFLKTIRKRTFPEIATYLTSLFFQDDLPKETIENICTKSFDFTLPLTKLSNNLVMLELFHGPTLAFKDFGARFMARITSYFARQTKKHITVLVATSGDTGSAVAAGFYKVPNIDVILLYPKGKVSPMQEKQLTTMGGNITALEIKGSFDDCQKLVKRAFGDYALRSRFTLTSANSINVARLLPQIFYYFYVYAKGESLGKPLVFSIPCGNLGNLTAAILAKHMGLPIARLIAATNRNDVFTRYIKTGIFTPKLSKTTLSNAMDVGNPSNFVRIVELYKNNLSKIRTDITSQSFSDSQTMTAIKEVWQKYQYIMDPHSAVAYLGLAQYQQKHPRINGIALATGHPAKFPELIENILHKKIPIPKGLKQALLGKKQTVELSNRFAEFKKYLLKQSVDS